MKLNIIDINGKQTGTSEVVFLESTLDDGLIHGHYLLDKYQKSAVRAGTASTKTKGEVSGGGVKPYKQKGTGHARRGSNRTPLRVGGGIVFGPKPRSFKHKLNSKQIALALRSAFAAKQENMVVLDVPADSLIKTAVIAKVLAGLNISEGRRALFILDINDHNIELGARNLANISIAYPNKIPVSVLLNADKVLISQAALAVLKEKVLV